MNPQLGSIVQFKFSRQLVHGGPVVDTICAGMIGTVPDANNKAQVNYIIPGSSTWGGYPSAVWDDTLATPNSFKVIAGGV